MLYRKLKKQPLHILLPIICSVAIAILALLVVFAVKDGVNAKLNKVISENGIGTKRLMIRHNEALTLIEHDNYFALKKIPEIKKIAAETLGWLTAPEDEKYRFRGLGVTEDYFEVRRFPLDIGRSFTLDEVENQDSFVVIGADIRQVLFPDVNPLGQIIEYYGVKYTVIGVLKQVNASERSPIDSNANQTIFLPYTASIPVGNRLSQVWLDSGSLSSEKVAKLLRETAIFPEDIGFDLTAQEDFWEYANYGKNKIITLLLLISMIIVILAGVNVMMVSLSSINSRLYEIGIKKAFGANNRDIFKSLLKEGTILFVLGGILGSGLFFAVRLPLTKILQESLVPNYVSFIKIALVILGVGFVVSLYPAYLGAKLPPLDAIYKRGYIINKVKKDVFRKMLVITGVSISIIAVTMISVISGAYLKHINDLTEIFSDDLLYIQKGYELPRGFVQPPEITYGLYEALKTGLNDVKNVLWIDIYDNVDVIVNDRLFSIPVYEIDESFFGTLGLDLAQGVMFKKEMDLIIGENLASALKLEPGNTIGINEETYNISGVLKEIPVEVGGYRRYDYGSYIFKQYSNNEVSKMNEHQILIKIINSEDYDKIIAQADGISKQLYPDKGSLPIKRPIETNSQIKNDLIILKNVSLIYAIIALLVSGIGVMNLMLISVGSRQKELGIRRATGASRIDITKMILSETVIIAILGGICGLCIGIVLSYIMAKYYLLDYYISILTLLPALIFSIICGMVAGVYPAYRANRLNLNEILKPTGE